MTYHAASSIGRKWFIGKAAPATAPTLIISNPSRHRRWFIGKAAPVTTDHGESVYGPIHTTQMTAMWFRNAAQTPVIYHIPAGAYFFQYMR